MLSSVNRFYVFNLLATVFESNNFDSISDLINAFRWDIVSGSEHWNRDEVTSFLKVVCDAFALSIDLIESAYTSGHMIFQIFFSWTDDSEFQIKTWANLALVFALKFGGNDIRANLIRMGIIRTLGLIVESSLAVTEKLLQSVPALIEFGIYDNNGGFVEDLESLELEPWFDGLESQEDTEAFVAVQQLMQVLVSHYD
jgi:hypothetical protein